MQKYLLNYTSIFRDKEWASLAKQFKAPNDLQAIAYANEFIKAQNRRGGVELFEFLSLEKVIARESATKVLIISGA